MGWEGIDRESGMDRYTLLTRTYCIAHGTDGQVHTANKNLLYRTWNSAQSSRSLDGREVWGRMDTCVCTAESLHCSPDIITILLIGYNPIES